MFSGLRDSGLGKSLRARVQSQARRFALHKVWRIDTQGGVAADDKPCLVGQEA